MGALVSCCLKLGLDLRMMTAGSKQDRRQNLQSLLSDKDSDAVDGRKGSTLPPNAAQVKEDAFKSRPGPRLGDKSDRPMASPPSPNTAKPPGASWNSKDKRDPARTGSWKRQVSFGTFNEAGRPQSPNSH